MNKEQLKEYLNNRENWKLFEELANGKELELLPTANLRNVDLKNADLEYVNLREANLRNADFEYARFGRRKLVENE